VAKNFEPTGKVRILIRTEIRILPVSTSADPHIRILPPACEISVRKNEDTTKRSTKLPQDTTGDRS